MTPRDSPTAGPTTRRWLLKLAGAGVAAGMAGCVETLPPLGQRVRYGRVDLPEPSAEPGDPVYRRWLPAASALPDDFDADSGEETLEPGWVNHVEPGALDRDFDGDGGANRMAQTFQVPHLDYFGVGYANFDRVTNLHGFGTTFVLEGDFDPGAVGTTLADSGYAAAGSYGGYDVFDRDGGRRTAAVGDGAVVWANHARSRPIVEAVVDAERGAVARHHEESESFAVATDRVGARAWTWVDGLGMRFGGEEHHAMSTTMDDEAVYTVFHQFYPPGETVSERTVRDVLGGETRALEAGAVDVRIDGRVATVELRRPHAAVDDPYEGVAIPQVTWGATLGDGGPTEDGDGGTAGREGGTGDGETGDEDTTGNGERVAIRHEAGDAVPAATLAFFFENPAVEDPHERRSPTDRQFADVTDTVRPGDAIEVPAPDDPSGMRLVGEFSPPDEQATSVFVVTRFR